MRVALDVLRRFTDVPGSPRDVRHLLDDLGVEVKRVEGAGERSVLVLELLANRGDHHCYEGIAREIAARNGGTVRFPKLAKLDTGAPSIPLVVASDLCLVYTATLLERGSGPDAVDMDAARVLDAADTRALGAAVDATNVANFEVGQPTHAFDADAIEGTLTIRTSRKGESAWLLFTAERVAVPEGTLVIADDRKILAIAGVIGCEESKTTPSTKRLMLESATFDPVAVRKASRALHTITDSSARFERGADPERALTGAARVVELLEKKGAFRRNGPTAIAGAWRNPLRTIDVDSAAIDSFLHTSLGPDGIKAILTRYGYAVRSRSGRLDVTVPSWRLWDVAEAADVVEDVARAVGYDALPTALPVVGSGSLPSPEEIRRARADEVLVGLGFQEICTDGFYGRHALEQLGIDEKHPLARHVRTTNAVDRANALLKNNALHQAIEAVATNERRRVENVSIFEWTRTFHPIDHAGSGAPDPARPPCSERKLLWAITSGRDRPRKWDDRSRLADVVFLKGVVEELSVELGRPLALDVADTSHPLADFLHPGRRAAIVLDGARVGVLGELHPVVARRYKLRSARPSYLEIDAGALLTEGRRPPFVEPSDLQPVDRSVALAVPAGIEAGDIAHAIRAASPTWLERIEIVDLFALTDGARSVTYQLSYVNVEGGRAADDVNEAVEAAMRSVLATYGPRGVARR